MVFPGDSDSKESACNAGDPRVRSLGRVDPLEEGIATHSSVLAWRIPWTEEPGGLECRWGRKDLDTTERLVLSNSVGQAAKRGVFNIASEPIP